MRLLEAKDCIKELYLKTGTVTALISERGVGKTSAYKQCADELGIEYIDLYAAALEGPDFMGLPIKDLENGITRYLAPQFLPTKTAIKHGLYGEKGILVLEEINRVPSDTISVLYPLLLEKKINGHELGEGWRIGVTMNPDTLNYLVNSLDDAMIDRFISISVDPFIDDYVAYSRKNNGNEEILNFLMAQPDMLLVKNKTTEISTMIKSPTPRGWTKVQEIMNTCVFPEELLIELIAGIVGPIAAASFIGHRRENNIQMPSADKIIVNYVLEREKVLTLIKEQQTPILAKLIETVIGKLKSSKAMVNEVDQFIADLPDELKVFFYKLLTRDKQDIFEYYSNQSQEFEAISDQIIDIVTA
jgi:hypothetical protein